MSIAEKLTTIAENQQKVYEAGQQAEYDKFWDAYQNYGNRRNYNYAFLSSEWTDEVYNPKYPIVATAAVSMFFNNSAITSTKVPIDVTNAGTLTSTFASTTSLKSIPKLIVSENTIFSNTFASNRVLEELMIEGTIASNGFAVQSPYLTHDSIMSIINALKSGVTKTLTLGAANLEKLTDAEKAIATEKGWTLA